MVAGQEVSRAKREALGPHEQCKLKYKREATIQAASLLLYEANILLRVSYSLVDVERLTSVID